MPVIGMLINPSKLQEVIGPKTFFTPPLPLVIYRASVYYYYYCFVKAEVEIDFYVVLALTKLKVFRRSLFQLVKSWLTEHYIFGEIHIAQTHQDD